MNNPFRPRLDSFVSYAECDQCVAAEEEQGCVCGDDHECGACDCGCCQCDECQLAASAPSLFDLAIEDDEEYQRELDEHEDEDLDDDEF